MDEPAMRADDCCGSAPRRPRGGESEWRSADGLHRLRQLCEETALTQTDLAHTLGITQQRVSRIEGRRVTRIKLDTLSRYAQALGGTVRVEVRVGDDCYRIL